MVESEEVSLQTTAEAMEWVCCSKCDREIIPQFGGQERELNMYTSDTQNPFVAEVNTVERPSPFNVYLTDWAQNNAFTQNTTKQLALKHAASWICISCNYFTIRYIIIRAMHTVCLLFWIANWISMNPFIFYKIAAISLGLNARGEVSECYPPIWWWPFTC